MESYKIDGPPWSAAISALCHFDALERLIGLGQTALDAELSNLYEAMDRDYASFKSPDDEATTLLT